MNNAIAEDFETSNCAVSFNGDVDWKMAQYKCLLCLIPEDDGTWSALVLSLPGAGSCGPTREEAVERAREAISGLIKSYTEDGIEVPWCNPTSDNVPPEADLLWIVVNA